MVSLKKLWRVFVAPPNNPTGCFIQLFNKELNAARSNQHSPPNTRKSNGKSREENTDAECNCGDSRNNDAGIPSRGNKSGDQEKVSDDSAEKENMQDQQESETVKESPDDIIFDRQKIKESDVFKRAMEEELEARQQQLRIQSEEAQRLRRGKKAERNQKMRVTDLERRKKKRVEEMRETRKKDEDNLRLKEQLRSEWRKKLDLIQNSCKNMASCLRELGVDVGSNLSPSPAEVQAAYKKALLKFHPDHASRTDMRQQVEAEEKFKFIIRMKEKYLRAR